MSELEKPPWYGTEEPSGQRGPDGAFLNGNVIGQRGGNPALKHMHKVKRAFKEYVDENHPDVLAKAIRTLIDTMEKGETERIRFEAAESLLNRYCGRAPVAINFEDGAGEPLEIVIRHTMHKAIEDAERND